MKISLQQFQRETGCSDAERRLVANSPLSGRASDGRIDGNRARQVLSGIRLARQIARLDAIYDGCADL